MACGHVTQLYLLCHVQSFLLVYVRVPRLARHAMIFGPSRRLVYVVMTNKQYSLFVQLAFLPPLHCLVTHLMPGFSRVLSSC